MGPGKPAVCDVIIVAVSALLTQVFLSICIIGIFGGKFETLKMRELSSW